jgi:Family of unknown function (DUF6454)
MSRGRHRAKRHPNTGRRSSPPRACGSHRCRTADGAAPSSAAARRRNHRQSGRGGRRDHREHHGQLHRLGFGLDSVIEDSSTAVPGGIDAHATTQCAPVGEYRFDSRSIVYRVDLESLEVREASRVDHQIGGVIHDSATGRVHGVSWAPRRLHTWSEGGAELQRRANPSHYVDDQNCQVRGARSLICGGIATIATGLG